jgi:short-subunit dehydrogenase
MSKTILITGASRGFGKLWAQAFLNRGDKVIATARDTSTLNDLIKQFGNKVFTIQLNVNNREDCFNAVKQANERFGQIDVLINNAGYGLFGAVEETSEQEARDQMETNFFGTLWMTQAVLPIMRKQKRGHIIQVSSYLGLITLPVLGIYNASKFAVEGFSETLATEVKHLGINISLVEPNAYATDWSGASAFQTQPIEAYNPVKEAFQKSATPDIFGKPEATVAAIIKLVDSTNPPLHLLFGKFAYPSVKNVYEQRLASFEEWKAVSESAHG